VTLKPRVGVVQGHWKWRRAIDHITFPTLVPVRHRIEFKTATLCFRAVKLGTISYLNDMLKPYAPLRAPLIKHGFVNRSSYWYFTGSASLFCSWTTSMEPVTTRAGSMQCNFVLQVKSQDALLPPPHGQLAPCLIAPPIAFNDKVCARWINFITDNWSYTTFYWSAIVSIALRYFRVIWRWIISWPWNLGQRSFKFNQTGTIRKIGCGFLFTFHSNYGRISYTEDVSFWLVLGTLSALEAFLRRWAI